MNTLERQVVEHALAVLRGARQGYQESIHYRVCADVERVEYSLSALLNEVQVEAPMPADMTALARRCADLEEQNKKLRAQAQQYAQEHIVELERATAMALVLATLVKTLQDERVRALSPQIEEMCDTLSQCITTGLAAVMTEDKDAG